MSQVTKSDKTAARKLLREFNAEIAKTDDYLKAVDRLALRLASDVTSLPLDWLLDSIEAGSRFYDVGYVPITQVVERTREILNFVTNGK